MRWDWAFYGIFRNVEFLKQRRILPKYVRKDQFESPKLWVFPSWKFLIQDDVGGGENWWRNYHGEDFSQSSLNTRPPPPRQFSHSTLSKVVAWGAAAAIIYRSRRHNWLENVWIYILSTVPQTSQVKPGKTRENWVRSFLAWKYFLFSISSSYYLFIWKKILT